MELTIKEREFIRLKAAGLKMWEIAECLFMHYRTVEDMERKIYEKTETNNGASLTNWAWQNGILKINVENHNNEERKTG
jgi:DNA-binding CsgD family transcriptional regulator